MSRFLAVAFAVIATMFLAGALSGRGNAIDLILGLAFAWGARRQWKRRKEAS